MIATIHTTARTWVTEIDGEPAEALPNLWKQIQNRKVIRTVLVSLEGQTAGNFPVLFNSNQVIAVSEWTAS